MNLRINALWRTEYDRTLLVWTQPRDITSVVGPVA
jgi:hypothetical protein